LAHRPNNETEFKVFATDKDRKAAGYVHIASEMPIECADWKAYALQYSPICNKPCPVHGCNGNCLRTIDEHDLSMPQQHYGACGHQW
jgi:hypothetical protein